MGDQSALLRQWILLKLLGVPNASLTVSEMAGEMDVSEKTIRRDLVTFKTIGFPIEESMGDHGRKAYRLDSGERKPDLGFTFDEALALYLGRKLLQPLEGTLVWEAAERAFRKIRASLGRKVLGYLDRMGRAFCETSFGTSDYSKHAEILDHLLVGIEDRKVVRITYQSQRATEPVTYAVHPYRLTRHQGALYLIGLKAREEELRTWRVDRIEGAEVAPLRFTVPNDLDVDARFAGSLGIYDGNGQWTVRIRFLRSVARFVSEKKWHASQQLIPQRDGSLIAVFRLSSTAEVKPWILGFGSNAEVLEPAELRAEICTELQAMLGTYGGRARRNEQAANRSTTGSTR